MTDRFETTGFVQWVREVRENFRRRPMMQMMKVIAQTSPTITCETVGPSPQSVPGVRCCGFGTITLPTVNSYVWVLQMEGSNPIAIGNI